MKTLTITLGAFALAAMLFANSPQHEVQSCCAPKMAMQSQNAPAKAVPAKEVKGVQKMTVVIDGGKYTPALILVKKGKPVELTFVAGKSPGCGSTVVFKSLKVSKDVPKDKSVTIKFTPKEAGQIAFTCGMGMYDGKVVVK